MKANTALWVGALFAVSVLNGPVVHQFRVWGEAQTRDVPKPDPNKPDKPSKPDKPNKPDKPTKPDKPDKPNKPDKPDKPKCHTRRYICGHHTEDLNGVSVSVPDWCTETVCP